MTGEEPLLLARACVHCWDGTLTGTGARSTDYRAAVAVAATWQYFERIGTQPDKVAGWFGVREKYRSRLEIYDRLRASEQAARSLGSSAFTHRGFPNKYMFQLPCTDVAPMSYLSAV